VLEALDARLDLAARWNAGDLDRLLNARHSAMHELVATTFRELGDWETAPEKSFSIYGERGVIDLLAWHRATRTLLIIEMKTEIVDVNELMAKADQRRRLAAAIGAELGWRPSVVAHWLVVADSRTNRRLWRLIGRSFVPRFPRTAAPSGHGCGHRPGRSRPCPS
jgi:hypothetical protein